MSSSQGRGKPVGSELCNNNLSSRKATASFIGSSVKLLGVYVYLGYLTLWPWCTPSAYVYVLIEVSGIRHSRGPENLGRCIGSCIQAPCTPDGDARSKAN